MKIAISQSNYLPWKGYFDLIASVDRFILYDTVQFTKNDWRNRNVIKTRGGLQWLTIPVGADIHRRICDVALPDTPWRRKHWAALTCAYAQAPHFDAVMALLHDAFHGGGDRTLSALNARLLRAICGYLGIDTEIVVHDGRGQEEDRVLKLVEICRRHGARTYLSAPAGRQYIDPRAFEQRGLSVEWFNYDGYAVYPQSHGHFVHQVSIVDALFHCGPDVERILGRVAEAA